MNMTAQQFVVDTGLNSSSQVFSIQSGTVVVVDAGVIASANFTGVNLADIVREIISQADLDIILARKPRAFTGKKWTGLSKERVNNELKTWPPMTKGIFSLDEIQPTITERRRLRNLEPCYTYEHLCDYAHYKRGLSWAKSESYAKWACCDCCYD